MAEEPAVKLHVPQVSSGAASAFVWHLMLEEHGPENVVGLFADVNGEDPDNYRFLAEVHFALGMPRLVKLTNNGDTIWDVFKREKFLGNTRVSMCSRILKFEACEAWLNANTDDATTMLYLGIDWTEAKRFTGYEDTKGKWHPGQKERWGAAGYEAEAPMVDRTLDSSHVLAWLKEIGVEPPELTRMGWNHANCMGGCVRSGAKQFRDLLEKRPEAFDWWERNEEAARAIVGDYAILRDRRGGKSKPMPLSAAREAVEASNAAVLTLFDADDAPVCGCYDEGIEVLS